MSNARLLLRAAAARLEAAGVASPGFDAAELLAFVTGANRMAISVVDVLPEQQIAYEELIERRANREPLQHLTGVAHFRYVELEVGPGVFVPRPETELLAGWAIDEARVSIHRLRRRSTTELSVVEGLDTPPAAALDHPSGRPPVVVDLCTGSGAIAKSVAHEVPEATVYAVELSDDALQWAERNLRGTGVRLSQGDLATALPDLDGQVDVVVCNPPYIPLEAWESVAVEARDHDPHLALFSGEDGLDAMRALEATAARLLKPGGVVGAEHADAQGEAAPAVFHTGRWTEVRDHADLAGRPRYLTARLAR